MRLLHGGSWWSVPEGDEPLCLAGLCVPARDADAMGRGAGAVAGSRARPASARRACAGWPAATGLKLRKSQSRPGAASISARVYSWRGSVSTVSALPVSTTLPRCMTMMVSQICAATRRSWVMKSTPTPVRCRTCSSSSSTCACTETSSADTASSATRISGSMTSARAMQMRWRWPPENWCG